MQRQRFIPVVLFGLLAAAAPPAHAQTAAPATPEQVFDLVAQTESAAAILRARWRALADIDRGARVLRKTIRTNVA